MPAPTSGDTATYHLRYFDSIEILDDDEDETIASIIEAMQGESRTTEERYGRPIRTSHAKSHGLARGELVIDAGLPDELRQGLFAQPNRFPVIVRLAHVPGEFLDDSKVSTPRGMALKILGVTGERLAADAGGTTQDFLLGTGPVFPSPGPKTFLATIRALAAATPAPEMLKQAMSATSRLTNAALNAVGANSPNLDFFGHPRLHPLTETYYSQTAYRHGDHVAKLRVRPLSPGLMQLAGQTLDPGDDANALRTAVTAWLQHNDAEYEFAFQLCTNTDEMPVEDAHAEWSEDASPYRRVARLVLPAQDAYSPARQQFVDEMLSFCPSHTLAAHRPLGGMNRARLRIYPVMAAHRRGGTLAEPAAIDELPA